MKQINTSIKHNTTIAALLAAWSFVFAFFIKPFEHGTMDTERWIEVSVGFSLIAFISYFMVSRIQNLLFKKFGTWNLYLELLIYVLFYSCYTIISFTYYRSPIIKGFYTFFEFFSKIILNIILIFTPIMFFARHFASKLIPRKEEKIIIRGVNKLDVLKIKPAELICISNAQNYVEVYYLEQNTIKSKLIRSSLKKMQSDHDFLIQVHRSHLINPEHFKSWKDSNTIMLTQMELPVSKNYKSRLLAL